MVIHGVPQLRGRPVQAVIGLAHFALRFLSPSVEVVQAVGRGHAALGARGNLGGDRPLTSRSTGHQKRTAFGSLRLRSGAGYHQRYVARRVKEALH